MGAHRWKSASPLLQAHGGGPEAARERSRFVRAGVDRHRANPQADMKSMTPGEALRRLQYLLLRDRYTRELEEEMRLHRALRAERLQGGGLSPTASRYAAQRRFGNATHHQERSRDMWGLAWLDNSVADLRFAIRRLR